MIPAEIGSRYSGFSIISRFDEFERDLPGQFLLYRTMSLESLY